MTRLLVTGGAGFIGSHLTRSLLGDGYDVDVVDVLSTGRRENVPDGARLLEIDLAGAGATERLPHERYEAVLHLAAQASGEKSFDDPLLDFDLNARTTLALALWARERAVPAFLYASSMGVYGDVPSHPSRRTSPPGPCRTTAPRSSRRSGRSRSRAAAVRACARCACSVSTGQVRISPISGREWSASTCPTPFAASRSRCADRSTACGISCTSTTSSRHGGPHSIGR